MNSAELGTIAANLATEIQSLQAALLKLLNWLLRRLPQQQPPAAAAPQPGIEITDCSMLLDWPYGQTTNHCHYQTDPA